MGDSPSSLSGEASFWRLTAVVGLWGGAFAAVLATGLFGFMEGHLVYGAAYCAVGAVGLAAMTLHLFGKLWNPNLALVCAVLVATWVMLVTDIWKYYSASTVSNQQVIANKTQPNDVFADVARHAEYIGKPIGDVIVATDAVLSVYDHAVVIYLQPLGKIFRLKVIPMTYIDFADPIPTSDPHYFDDLWLQNRLGLPRSCLPPLGGTAKRWEEQPFDWKWIGCRKWHCVALPGSVKYQAFENGYVISGFPDALSTVRGQTYYLENSSWSTYGLLKDVNPCSQKEAR